MQKIVYPVFITNFQLLFLAFCLKKHFSKTKFCFRTWKTSSENTYLFLDRIFILFEIKRIIKLNLNFKNSMKALKTKKFNSE